MEPEKIKAILGKNVKFYRNHRGLSQSELANKAELSVTFLSNIERGIMFPKVETLSRLTTSLEVEVYELFKTDIVDKDQKEMMNRFSSEIRGTLFKALDNVITKYLG